MHYVVFLFVRLGRFYADGLLFGEALTLEEFLHLLLVRQNVFQLFLAWLIGGDTHWFGVILKNIFNVSAVGILA